MKKTIIFVIFFCILAAPISWSQTKSEKDENISKQVMKLKKQVERLEKRIKSLEKQLQSFDGRSNKILKNVPQFQILPEGWREVEYEGLTYYIVPLANETKKK